MAIQAPQLSGPVRMTGTDQNDTMRGGAGDDTMTGGSGNDAFNGGMLRRAPSVLGDKTDPSKWRVGGPDAPVDVLLVVAANDEKAVADRADVAAELLASLDDAEADNPAEVEAAWAAEIERRARRVLTGESAGLAWNDVRRRAEADLRKP